MADQALCIKRSLKTYLIFLIRIVHPAIVIVCALLKRMEIESDTAKDVKGLCLSIRHLLLFQQK